MIQLYANDQLIYTNAASDNLLTALKTTETVNKSGSISLTLPPEHPYTDAILMPKAVLRMTEDDALVFRGRVLSYTSDTQNQLAVTGEGELGFLQDSMQVGVTRVTEDAASFFRRLIDEHNEQVESYKQFKVGTVTIQPNTRARVETDSRGHVTTLTMLEELVNQVGGYLHAADGEISWLRNINLSKQEIRYGYNLVSFKRSVSYDSFATVVYAYGTSNDNTPVNLYPLLGVAYVADEQAVAKWGWIPKCVFFKGTDTPEALFAAAQRWLHANSAPTESIDISAVDRHWTDRSVPRFRAAENVHIVSAPHRYENALVLDTVTCDWLHPGSNKVQIGKTKRLV